MKISLTWDGPRYSLWIAAGFILGNPLVSNWWAAPVAALGLVRIERDKGWPFVIPFKGSKEDRDV